MTNERLDEIDAQLQAIRARLRQMRAYSEAPEATASEIAALQEDLHRLRQDADEPLTRGRDDR